MPGGGVAVHASRKVRPDGKAYPVLQDKTVLFFLTCLLSNG